MKNFPFNPKLVVLAAVATLSASAWAANFTVGGIKYTSITEPSGSENGTCKVAYQNQDIEGDIVIPDFVTYGGKNYDVVEIASQAFSYNEYYDIELTSVTIGNNVRKIGSSAFSEQYYLKSVTFGNSVTEIGGSAFYECSLTSVTLPAGVKEIKGNTFYGNMSLRSVTLNEGLETISQMAFYGVNNLAEITIPSTVTSIDFAKNAFGNCTNLTAMNVAPGNTAYRSVDGIVYTADGTSLLFSPLKLAVENLTFPFELTGIGSAAFKNNKTIKTVTFPPELASIGSDAFNGCSSLTSLTFPTSLRTIGEYAFANCTGLTSISLNDGLQTIDQSAFKSCTGLTSLSIPATVGSIQWSSFTGCTSLKKIAVAPENGVYSSDGYSLMETATGTLLNYATASPLKSYTVPDNVKKINSFAIEYANNLEVLDLNKTSVVDNDAIAGLESLRDLSMGQTISLLSDGAVELCPNLNIIRLNCSVPPETGGSRDPFPMRFNAGGEGTLYVPDATLALYRQSMYWSGLNLKAISEAPAIEPPVEDVTTAHAYSMGSRDSKFGFVDFPVNDIDAWKVVKATSSSDDQVGAGEYVDGKLYAYTVYYDYVMGDGLEPSGFKVYNPENFTATRTTDPDLTGRVVDMTYDYAHNTMYALVEENRTTNGMIGLTALNVVDLATGNVTRVGLPGDIKAQNGNGQTVEEHLVGLASDPTDGTLYAMGEYRQLYTLDRMTGAATARGQRNRVAINNDFQSMSFDAQGNLYQAQCHPDYEYFMRIDTADGKLYNPVTGEAVTVNSDFTNNAARFPEDPQLTALYFTDKTFVSAAPKAVTALTASIAPTSPNAVTLTWTLPTENYDGSAAAVTEVQVYRFGTAAPLATLPAGSVTYTDNNAPNGDVSYYVVANAGTQAGFPAWTTIFAGADRLKAVRELAASLEGNEATITWKAPTETVNGGYADYNNITYTVKSLKGEEQTLLAENVVGTSYVATLENNGTYQFIVIPNSCGVAGVPALSNPVTLQGVESLPYTCGFEDNDGGTLWTIVNQNTGSYGWSIVEGYAYQRLDGKFAQFKTGGSSTFPANDWLISPAIACPQGEYELTYFANGGSFDTHTYKVFIGADSTDPADFTQEIYSLTDEKVYSESTENKNYVPVSVKFNIDATGDYRIGFKGIGAATYATLRFDNVKLVCTKLTGIDGIESGSDGIRLVAPRTVACETATAIDAYALNGMHLGHADGTTLTLPATGAVIVKATTAAGVSVAKFILK